MQIKENSEGEESILAGDSDFRKLSIVLIVTWFPFPLWFSLSVEGFSVITDGFIIEMGWVILNIVSKFLFIIMMQRYKMIHQRKIEAARELYGLSPSDDVNEEELKKQALTNGVANGGINAEAYGLGQGEEAQSELKLVELVAETMGPFCSFHLSTKTMSRVAGIVFAASLALYGASCFIVPATLPKGAPQTESGAVVGQPSAINGTPQSASWSPLAVGAALGLLIAVATGRPAFAADLENGEAIFNGNCTACHAGGNNSIVAEKKLKKEALVQYGKYDVQAIITQVTNGNGAMPAFGEKLGPDDIEDVANYVYSKADKCHVTPWIPTSLNARWHRSNVVFWKCTGFDDANAYGVIVDPQLPALGQHMGSRTFRSTTSKIAWSLRFQMPMRVGQIYVTFGSVAPCWRDTQDQWQAEMPTPSFCSGVCRIAGQFAPGANFNVAEFFSGYMGGWAAAAEELPHWDVQVALDNDKAAVSCYCLNHPGQVVHDPAHLGFPISDQRLIICSDFENLAWTNAFNFRNVNTFSVSAPCQSWSGMGTKSGSASENGRVLIRTVQAARLLQPALVMVEQVAGFRQHPEFEQFITTMQEAGFRLMASSIHDLELLSYTTRRRWFGIFLNTVHVRQWEHVGRWLHPILREKHTYQPSYHCITVMTESQRAIVTISEEDFQIMNDPGLLPKWTRHAPGAQSGAMHFRVQGVGMIWPTIPASYRSSVSFGRDYLTAGGLMTWVIRDAYGDVRWASKFEAARALGFSVQTILPVEEDEGFKAVGQSISPLQAALVMCQAQEVCRLQGHDTPSQGFAEVVEELRGKQGPMDTFYIRSHGLHHECLASRLPTPTQVEIRCPHCHATTDQPLILACPKCCMVACHRCLTDTCLDSHFRVVQECTEQQELEELNRQYRPPATGVRLFKLVRVETGFFEDLECDVAQSVGQVYLYCDLPQGSIFFKDQIMVRDDYPPQHGDVLHAMRNTRTDDACPLCHTFAMNTQLRLCLMCKRIGCALCIADKCARCTGGALSCRTCHERVADSYIRALHEQASLRLEHDIQPQLPEWDWTLSCDIEGEWELLTVLAYPVGRATVKRSLFHNAAHIIDTVNKMGYDLPNEVQLFWGDSTTPNLLKAIEGYILVVPTNQLGMGRIPIICRTHKGEQIKMCPPTQPVSAWARSMMTPDERQAGYKVLYRQQVLDGTTTLTLTTGDILTKIPAWKQQSRSLDFPEEGLRLLDSVMSPAPPEPLQTAGLGGSVPGTITNWCGVVMLSGAFQPLPVPFPGQTWEQWTAHPPLPPIDTIWATSNGKHLDSDQPLEGRPILLRLHVRVRGGAKANGKHDVVAKKLAAHLQTKGVPADEAPNRAEAVISALGLSRPGPKSALSSRKSSGRGPKPQPREVSEAPISLMPGFFLDADAQPLPILPHLVAEGKGVALLNVEETQTHASANYLLSEEELAAVVVSPTPPATGQMPCRPISFAAMHGDQKVLLRGYVVDFGQKQAKLKEAIHRVTVELENMATIAMEVRREYQASWDAVTRNPLRYAWSMVDGLQAATATTWSRKYFAGRKEAAAESATTWHCFAKIPGNGIDQFLVQSGKGGVFLIPKSNGETSLAGHFRVIWLDHTDLDRASTVQRTHPDILGLVRGRETLGVRVRASNYSSTRKKIEPAWCPQGLLTDLVVEVRWNVAPLPPHTDKAAVQRIIKELKWKAVPLKQLSSTTWVVGASEADPAPTDVFDFDNKPVLITRQTVRQANLPEQMVLAAPPASKKSLVSRFTAGRWQAPAIQSHQDSSMESTPGPPVTARSLLAELRDEVNQRLGDFQAQVQQAVNVVNEKVQEAQQAATTCTMETEAMLSRQEQRVSQLESSVQSLSSQIVTKTDLQDALKAAMELQSREIRLSESGDGNGAEGSTNGTVSIMLSMTAIQLEIYVFVCLNAKVRVISVYGYHSGIKDSVAKNDVLMTKILHRAQSFQLPVIIAGDLNCDINQLESWQSAVARGFVDIAARQASLMGAEPEPTYKGHSRLDYILCNRAAATVFQSLIVDPCGFSDHAVLSASFDWDMYQPVVPRWSFPRALDDNPRILAAVSQLEPSSSLLQEFQEAVSSADTHNALQVFAKAFEDKIDRAHRQVFHTPAPPKLLGRTRCKIQCKKDKPVTVDPASQSASDGVKAFCLDKAYRWAQELQALRLKNKDLPKRHVLWKHLLQCEGFCPCFSEWLLNHDVVPWIPFQLPDDEWLDRVVQALGYECKILQQLQSKEKNARIARAMRADWSKGGRLHSASIKPVPLGTLDSLMVVQERPFTLLRCHKDKAAQISFLDDTPTPPGAQLTFPTSEGPRNAAVTKVVGSKAQLDISASAAIRSLKTVQQKVWSTDTGYIASQVQSFWKTFWQPDSGPDMGQVTQMVECLPQIPQFDDTVCPQEVAYVIAKMPAGKARGMDGFSAGELKALGPREHGMLAQIFNLITQTGEWPQALLSSFVALLAKVPQPQTPKDARPITVLPTLYRLWGKIMGMKIMQALLPFLPDDLFGSVPGRSACDAAWELQAMLEQAASDDQQTLGVSLDLSKAYNTIPRQVVAALADRCGWPPSLKNAYLNFLGSFHRFFKLHGGFHSPTHSTNGVPEGCPIAVPVMIMTTFLVTNWTTASNDTARFLSYVDNWTLLDRSIHGLNTGLDRVFHATQSLALLLNPDKTRAFATTAGLRCQLGKLVFAGHRVKVCHSHDDLGVCFTSTLKPTSCSLQQRLKSNEAKLKKLQAMPWTAQRKVEVLNRTICPSLLHGVSWASTPATYIATLRGKFSAAIWGQDHHRDHFLGPLFSLKQTYEPYIRIFKLRMADIRRAFARNPAKTVFIWNAVVASPKGNGPIRYLIEMCGQIGILVQPDLQLWFPSGAVNHLCLAAVAHLTEQVTQAWLCHVAVKLQDKDGLEGLQAIDFAFSTKLRHITKVEPHILGSFTSNAAVPTRIKKKFLPVHETVCKHCGQDDDATHRLLHCPFYAAARHNFPVQEAEQWPRLLTERGLSRKPTSLQAWEQLNDDRPWPPMPECLDQDMHLFTDGSTDGGNAIPRSAWSVVMMEPGSFDNAVVQSGPLPGKQSNYRAELFAALAAIHSSPSATLYIDNSSVVQGLQRLQKDGWDLFYWAKNTEVELWSLLWKTLKAKNPSAWSFVHVKSHRSYKEEPDDFAAWTAYGNDQADKEAKRANKTREASESTAYHAASKDWSFQVQRMTLLAFLQKAVFQGRPAQEIKDPQFNRNPSTDDGASLQLGRPLPSLSVLPEDTYEDGLLGPRFLWVVHKWWSEQKWCEFSSGMSIAELYFWFSECTGWMAPQNLATWSQTSIPFEWKTTVQTAFATEQDYASLSFSEVPFAKQCTVFLHALKFFALRHRLQLGITRGQALSFLDCFDPVPMVTVAPTCLIQVRKLFRDRIDRCAFASSEESPWALIDAAQRRWTAEKMNMGQDSGGNIEKEDPFKKLLEANKERLGVKNLANSLPGMPGMYSGLNTPPVAGMGGMGGMGMMDMAGMEEQMMSVMNKVMVPFQDMVMGRMQAMEENIQRQMEMTQEAISQRMDFSQVSLLQTVNACQVLLHKLDSSQETVMQKMDTQKGIVDRMVESYSGLVQNIDSASDNTKRSLLDTVNTSSAVMLQKLDTTQQDLLKQTHESHAVLQGVAQSQTSLAKKVDSGNEFTTRRLVEVETCLSKK
ncbi:petJ, partial [Symbiodinium sp. CCMP2456]